MQRKQKWFFFLHFWLALFTLTQIPHFKMLSLKHNNYFYWNEFRGGSFFFWKCESSEFNYTLLFIQIHRIAKRGRIKHRKNFKSTIKPNGTGVYVHADFIHSHWAKRFVEKFQQEKVKTFSPFCIPFVILYLKNDSALLKFLKSDLFFFILKI